MHFFNAGLNEFLWPRSLEMVLAQLEDSEDDDDEFDENSCPAECCDGECECDDCVRCSDTGLLEPDSYPDESEDRGIKPAAA